MNLSREEAQQILDALNAAWGCLDAGIINTMRQVEAASRLLQSRLAEGGQEPVKRNNPVSALAINWLVNVGAVSQEIADKAFSAACYALEDEAQRIPVGTKLYARPRFRTNEFDEHAEDRYVRQSNELDREVTCPHCSAKFTNIAAVEIRPAKQGYELALEPVALLEQSAKTCLENFGQSGMADWIYNDLFELFSAAPQGAQRAQGWQPIKTPPLPGIDVLLGSATSMTVGYYVNHHWVTDSPEAIDWATHWMPLPASPKDKS